MPALKFSRITRQPKQMVTMNGGVFFCAGTYNLALKV